MATNRSQERRLSPVTIAVFVFLALGALWFFGARESSSEIARSVQSKPRLIESFSKAGISGEKEHKENDLEADPLDENLDVSRDSARGEEQQQDESDSAAEGAELSVESKESPGSLITQAKESTDERNANRQSKSAAELAWGICSHNAGADYIPCLDNTEAIRKLRSTKHYEHRERHCPAQHESQACLVPLPDGYKRPIGWPRSRNEVWFKNVPHLGLISYKADQKWVTRKGEVLVFPGGGTQFKKGAMHYINYVEKSLPEVAWGRHTRVVLDVGCGVASFGGFLFEKDVLAMSFAPKDEHEAQVQLALERGIPALLAVMGTQQLPFPNNAYDAVHCARCRVPWHLDGAKLLVELNRLIRPGGYFIWSATPVYQRELVDVQIWKETISWAAKMCWKRLARTKDPQTGIGVAIFQKPVDNACYEQRQVNEPPLCEDADQAATPWYVPLDGCIPKIEVESEISWPEEWPSRLEATPKSLGGESEEFQSDTRKWKHIVQSLYERGLGIDWDSVRNVMDMKAGYGGFAAALAALPVWVMNVNPTTEPDSLATIFDRGLFGIYHDWCESFSTYPRTYDLLHADHLLVSVHKSCNVTYLFAEMDRMLRPQGWVIFRDKSEILQELVEPMVKSLHWHVSYSQEQDHQSEEQVLAVQKTNWRPGGGASF